MQERSHAFAMKSQMWLLDPRPNVAAIVDAVEPGFELSEASNTPVMLDLRLRSCHLHGSFVAKDNSPPRSASRTRSSTRAATSAAIVLPPASFVHEQEKINERWPAAVHFIKDRGLNEVINDEAADIGIITQGGLYNTVNRSLELLGCSDAFGNTRIPLYVMNVTYPVIDDEILEFCAGKRAVLLVEEGQPDYIEQNLNAILRRNGVDTALHGKDMLPVAGEYTSAAVTRARRVPADGPARGDRARAGAAARPRRPGAARSPPRVAAEVVQPRPPGLCTGCPERPIFSGMKLAERETGKHHVSATSAATCSRSTRRSSIGATTMGYGLGSAGAAALSAPGADRRTIAVMGDGGFWHNGLTSGVGNAVFNKSDQVLVVVDNAYAAATGGQDLLSSTGRSRDAFDPAPDRAGGARRRRRVGQDDRRHLRRRRACATRSSRR